MSRTGKFLGVPYDWRRPTVARLKSRWWNPNEPRLFTPKTYGWGFDINLARVVGRVTDEQRGSFMSDASSEKQDQILANQAAIIANQAKLDEILANQAAITSNQAKLDQILANQEKILSKLG